MLKIFLKWLVIIAVKIILFFALATLATKVMANDGRNASFPVNHFRLDGSDRYTVETLPEWSPGTKPYKPGRKSSLANRQLAPAYRLRQTPNFALKTNLLHDLTTSLNLGVELKIIRKITLDMPFTLNPWTYNRAENTKSKFFLAQPELRFWSCEAFNGHFFGIHGHYAYYNVGHLPFPPFPETMNLHRFEGKLLGAGVTYGYHWLVSPRWSIDAEIGAGYARLWYDKFPCYACAKLIAHEQRNYFGVTRAGISLLYLF